MKNILPLSKIDHLDRELVGHEALQLADIINAGVSIAPGFVITSDALREILRSTKLAEKLSQINLKDTNREDLLPLIKKTLYQTSLSGELDKELKTSLKALSKGRIRVEISSSGLTNRFSSSATSEKEAISAIKEIWGEAIWQGRLGIGVVVQKLLDPEVSGLGFSVDPGSNDKSKIVVEAIYGQPELLLEGEVNPDHYQLSKPSLGVVFNQPGFQDRQMIRIGKSYRVIKVSEAYSSKRKLSAPTLKKLGQMTQLLENLLQKPIQLQWVYDGKNLYITQVSALHVSKQDHVKASNLPLILVGSSASPGLVRGKAVIIRELKDLAKLNRGDILVAPHLSDLFIKHLKNISAIVVENGSLASNVVINARELGVAMILGAKRASEVLEEGGIYTVNATLGQVYKGSLSSSSTRLPYEEKTPDLTPSTLKTATKIIARFTKPELSLELLKDSDGVGLIHAEELIKSLGIHPMHVVSEKLEKAYVAKLSDKIKQVYLSQPSSTVLYRLSQLTKDEYANLKGGEISSGEEFDLPSAQRFSKFPEMLRLELEAIKKLRNQGNHKSLHILIPGIRHTKDLTSLKQLLGSAGLHRNSSFKIFMAVETPSNALNLSDFAGIGIDGLVVDLDILYQHFTGTKFDKNSPGFDRALIALIEKTGREARRSGLTIMVVGDALSSDPEVLNSAVTSGYSSVITDPEYLNLVKSAVARKELELVKKG